MGTGQPGKLLRLHGCLKVEEREKRPHQASPGSNPPGITVKLRLRLQHFEGRGVFGGQRPCYAAVGDGQVLFGLCLGGEGQGVAPLGLGLADHTGGVVLISIACMIRM